ncbi:hypothetical protein [Metallosphaera sedula]|uniref:hypothetical protein n=1 Tax=Metallosphaera sedula TaxID=43687 RepID=UPI0020BD893D|nr:hypothetical protein [Metallosphaera sedula]BBL46101.1 hypothetical protein MJ1HA_0193 [Metallosphaera sedula]
MTLTVRKANFKVVKDKPIATQEVLQIFGLAPTSDDGKSGEVIMRIKRLLEPREREVTIQNDEKRKGQKVKITDYRVIVEVLDGRLASIKEKEKVKVPGIGIVEVPRTIDSSKVEGEIILDLQRQSNHDFLKDKLEQGVIQLDTPYAFEYNVKLSGSKYNYYMKAIYSVEMDDKR